MKHKEEAERLIDLFGSKMWSDDDEQTAAKACAVICVKEIMKDREEIFHRYGIGFMGNAIARNDFEKHPMSKDWQKVLEEINK